MSAAGCFRHFMRWWKVVGIVLCGLWFGDTAVRGESDPVAQLATRVAPAPQDANPKLVAALKIARSSLDALASIRDYEAIFVKRELLGKKLVTQRMFLKLREKPFSVYVRFLSPHKGREVIYVEGKNGGHLLAHGTGLEALAGTVRLHPTSRDALKDNRYPITMLGMTKMVRKIIEQWERELSDEDVQVKYYPNAKLGTVECIVLETTHQRQHPGARFYRTRLFIEKERKLPIRVEQYAFPRRARQKPMLVEEYTYMDIRTNVGLTDHDFETSNPAYDF
ncbi:MAG: DUF1571 domain-containing protein [Planctomycetes bacterium]|nr:DUF1571 domain-containing protein [Planctomycetota bacterium]